MSTIGLGNHGGIRKRIRANHAHPRAKLAALRLRLKLQSESLTECQKFDLIEDLIYYLNDIINTILMSIFPIEIIFNILAGLVFLIYWGITFVILYHFSSFGIGVQPKKLAAIFLFGSVILSVIVIILFMRIDVGFFFL